MFYCCFFYDSGFSLRSDGQAEHSSKRLLPPSSRSSGRFEFELSLVYVVSSRTTRDMKRDHVSKNKQKVNKRNFFKKRKQWSTLWSFLFTSPIPCQRNWVNSAVSPFCLLVCTFLLFHSLTQWEGVCTVCKRKQFWCRAVPAGRHLTRFFRQENSCTYSWGTLRVVAETVAP